MIPNVTTSAPLEAVQASQNLFEHMAAQARGLPEGTGPAQLGNELLENMQGFIERVGRYGSMAIDPAWRGASPGAAGPAEATPRKSAVDARPDAKPETGEAQMLRLIESLGRTFDYSTEVAMVVRNTSGVSSSVNTLLRGQ